MADSNRARPRAKDATLTKKPRPDFPLFPHATGRWAKKVRGKLHYFGKTADDPNGQAALSLWLEQRDEILSGRKPRVPGSFLTVAELCDRFMGFKDGLRESGEIGQRTFDRYLATAKYLTQKLGRTRAVEDLRPEDFEALRVTMAKRWGAIPLGNEIQTVRSIFRYGIDAVLIEKAVRFGPGFKKPSAKTIRKVRTADGPKMFTAEQINAILKHATPNMKAMILLAINAGLGNTDLGALTLDKIDDTGWLVYAREKTAIDRKIPLWPETVMAIRESIEHRTTPRKEADADLLFIGRRGEGYLCDRKGYRVTQEFARVAKAAKVKGRAFYDLRRTFETIGEGCNDLVAVKAIMGHAPATSDMSAIYRQAMSDERLQAVTSHVREWLFKPGPKAKPRTLRRPSQTGKDGPRLRVVG